MDTLGVLTAIWVACWVATYAPDIKKDLGLDKPTEQAEKTNGTTTSPQK